MDGYKNKGSCITHNSRIVKNNTNYFIFQATYNEVPDLSGYVVFDYRTYGHLNFITLPVPDPVEELDVNIF